MLLKKTLLAATVAMALASGSVMADSWVVTQSASMTDTSNLTQKDSGGTATASALQGINVINTKTGASTVDGTQTVDVSSSKNLTFTQQDATTNSTQAGNYATVDATGSLGNVSGIGQKVTGATYTLLQSTTAGGNKQAVNFIETEGTLKDATQEIAVTGTLLGKLDMDQSTTSADSNIQAGNLLDAKAPTGTTAQKLYVTDLDMDQTLTKGKALQAGNAIMTVVGDTGGTVGQTFEVATADLNQAGAVGSTQAGNYIGVTP